MRHAHTVNRRSGAARSSTTPRASLAALLSGVMAAAGLLASSPVDAQHWHRHGPRIGVYIGPPVYRPYWAPRPYYWYGPGPYFYSPPYFAYPPAPAAPPVYVERIDSVPQSAFPAVPPGLPQSHSQPAPLPGIPAPSPEQTPQPLEPGYWYYCRSPAGYFPSVRECAGGWERVAPQMESTAPQQ